MAPPLAVTFSRFAVADLVVCNNTPGDLEVDGDGHICKTKIPTLKKLTLWGTFFQGGEVPQSRGHPAVRELAGHRRK
jgi:hypothetical protein